MPDKAARGRVPAVRFVDQKPNLTKVRGIGPEPKNWLRVFSNAEASRFGQGIREWSGQKNGGTPWPRRGWECA